jgi:tRNA-Thr(GGU) m(6)t(6)A37 methyltransferase TsaA
VVEVTATLTINDRTAPHRAANFFKSSWGIFKFGSMADRVHTDTDNAAEPDAGSWDDGAAAGGAEYTMRPIGVVRSPFKQKFGIPRQPHLAPSATATIELAPPFNTADAVKGLSDWSHVWVTFVFHKTIRDPADWKTHLVRPPRLGGRTRVGVFASRATYRPNPLGLSACKLEGVEVGAGGVSILLSGIDLLDGTPVLDIKPYLP